MQSTISGPIVLAGAGRMGAALLHGWLEKGVAPASIIVQEPTPAPELSADLHKRGIVLTPAIGKLDTAPSVIVVAVKPQVLDQVFPALAKSAGPSTVVLSIAAGKPISSFAAHLAPGAAIVRSMPNTPASIGRGITAAVANAHVTAQQRQLCSDLLGSVGEVVWLDDEGLIDAVTAVSGSGPAYVFLLAEALTKAGISAGLDAETAERLARATVSGSGELMARSTLPAGRLRENVTSPGGTTAAALKVLMRDEGGLEGLLTEAVLAAKKRGRELGS